MAARNEMVAMLLAGGQGSRLKALTRHTAKPAVPFGGKYKIIDFAISNAANSGIDNIGILTQYRHFLLNEHIGLGQAWDYDRLKVLYQLIYILLQMVAYTQVLYLKVIDIVAYFVQI